MVEQLDMSMAGSGVARSMYQGNGVATSDGTAGGRHYTPRWYSGHGFNDGFGDFASSLGSGFAGAVSAASTAPGSSSGSGGGGSSGGGGGGGGGGGW